jgi:hypothetical protein
MICQPSRREEDPGSRSRGRALASDTIKIVRDPGVECAEARYSCHLEEETCHLEEEN